jgi:hypothetical protein
MSWSGSGRGQVGERSAKSCRDEAIDVVMKERRRKGFDGRQDCQARFRLPYGSRLHWDRSKLLGTQLPSAVATDYCDSSSYSLDAFIMQKQPLIWLRLFSIAFGIKPNGSLFFKRSRSSRSSRTHPMSGIKLFNAQVEAG